MDEKRITQLKKDFAQGFPAYCGFEVKDAGDGLFETFLHIRKEHRQQDGFVHAGVMATMADHTAGYAAFTTVSDEFRILTIEFKINFFKPAMGEMLICRSKVINRGKTVIVAESQLFSVSGSQEKAVSKATVTLMTVPVAVINRDKI